MQIFYGLNNNKIDITNYCYTHLFHNDYIVIVNSDIRRAQYFGDPLPYIVKKIYINHKGVETEYDNTETIYINAKTYEITVDKYLRGKTELEEIHKNIEFRHGSLNDEYNEQLMVLNNLKGNEKILEIGGNIGRVSMIVSKLLQDDSHYVILESDEKSATQLMDNKILNNCNFNVLPFALSKRKLIQRGWTSVASDVVYPCYKQVNTITLEKLNELFNIEFDTLILDCEGAFYYILMDYPEILKNIKLIITENDYTNIEHYNHVQNELRKNGFLETFAELGGYGYEPCHTYFYQVWKKM